MQRLLTAALFLLLSIGGARADALVRNIAGNTTTPCLATAFFYVDQNGTDTKLACNVVINNSDLGTGVKTFLGTPSLSNLTSAVTGLGTNVGTLLGTNLAAGYTTFASTPSSANLATLLTDETGSGAAVFGTSPTIASPTITGTMALGTATVSGNFTVSGVPIMSGLSAGTIATGKYMGLDSFNNIVLAAGGGGGGSSCPSTIDTWDGTTNKTISATTGILYTTGSTPIAAPRTLTLPDSATYTVGCRIYIEDLAGIFNSTGTVTPTRASSDTIDGLTTGTPFVVASDVGFFDLLVAAKWKQSGVGIAPTAAVANKWVNSIPAGGVPTLTQPDFSNLSGVNTAAQIAGSAASHAVPVDVGGTPTWKVMPDCTDTGGNHINFTQSTDAFSCGTSGGGGGGGDVVAIATSPQVASSSASLSWTGLGSTYSSYKLVCGQILPATNNVSIRVQVGEGGTPTWETSGYVWTHWFVTTDGTSGSEHSTSDSGIDMGSPGNISSSGPGISFSMMLYNIQSTTKIKQTTSEASFWDQGNTRPFIMNGTGLYTADTNALTAIRVIASSGNLASGTCSLFGMK